MRVTRTSTTLELGRTPVGVWLPSLAFVAAGRLCLYVLEFPGLRAGSGVTADAAT